jgi:hypothetical protein
MKLRKLALTAAVSGVLAAGGGSVSAAITGVPGDAGMAPMILNSDEGTSDSQIETYIGLYVPTNIGIDTVINQYTAPNSAPTKKRQVLPIRPEEDHPTIYWAMFDENSKLIEDGECEVSLGDKTVWTTDYSTYQFEQERQKAGLADLNDDVPNPVCGPGDFSDRFGYVVFQTVAGADGLASSFAFWGNAWILDDGTISSQTDSIAAVPFVPLADGPDSSENAPTIIGNEVVNFEAYGDGQTTIPVSVAPIIAGIRMNNAQSPTNEDVTLQAEIRGPVTGWEQSMHVFWFDQNLPNDSNPATRTARYRLWDDQQGDCTDDVKLPRELNILLYNNSTSVTDGAPTWDNLVDDSKNSDERRYISVIDAVEPPDGFYRPSRYCLADYWLESNFFDNYEGALNGYIDYKIREEGVGAGPGNVDRAAFAFNWQESLGIVSGTGVASGWSTHMTTDLGKQ